jgi:hypothetical protein
MSKTKIAINRKDKSRFIMLGIISFLFMIYFSSCKEDTKKQAILKTAKESTLNVSCIRFEREIVKLQSSSYAQLDSFALVHHDFFELYNNRIIGIGSYKDAGYNERINGFLNDKTISDIMLSIDSVYADFSQMNEISNFFKAYHSYFPNRVIPRVYTFVSGFSYAIAPTDSVLGIGLDYFLGSTKGYYNSLQLPEYQKRKLTPEYLTITASEQWIRTEFQSDSLNKNLLSELIAEGRVLYATEQCFEEQNDTLLFGFTKAQLEWCKQSESAIWSFLIDKKLLYLTNKTDYNRYIVDGPFTPGMPRESPAKAVCWIGYNIVNSFMKNHPKISLEKLLTINNAQYILNNSKYKPSK